MTAPQSASSNDSPDAAAPPPDPQSIVKSRKFVGLLVVAAFVGVLVSFAAWAFLELVYWIQQWVFTDIPKDVGFDSTPMLWYPPVLVIAGLITAWAIVRLPGNGGHIPADGLNAGVTPPRNLPGVVLAALASIGLGLVVGPEAPLIAIGGGLGMLIAGRLKSDTPDQVGALLAATAVFAALAFLFGSPLIAAVILIEASGLGGARLSLVLLPGLLGSGIGSLTWIGLGSISGLSTTDIAISPLDLPAFPTPDVTDFGWTILLALVVAAVTFVVFRLAKVTQGHAARKPFVVLPLVGLVVACLGIFFTQATDHTYSDVLFSGESQLDGLVDDPTEWSLGALALLLACKGLAYALSLGSFRGGPAFPAIFLGSAAGLMAARLPGFELTPAVAVAIGAAVASSLRLPLGGVVLAVMLTAGTGTGSSPLIIVGVVVAYLVTLALEDRFGAKPAESAKPADEPSQPAGAARPAPT